MGCKVYVNARRADRLSKLQGCIPLVGDVSKPSGREKIFSSTAGKKMLSEVTVLINNAGLARGFSKVQEADPADWDEMIDTNIKGLIETNFYFIWQLSKLFVYEFDLIPCL